MPDAIIVPLAPFVDATSRPGPRPPVLRIVAVGAAFELGVTVPGYSEMRGGILTPQELLALGRALVAAATEGMASEWGYVPSYGGAK